MSSQWVRVSDNSFIHSYHKLRTTIQKKNWVTEYVQLSALSFYTEKQFSTYGILAVKVKWK